MKRFILIVNFLCLILSVSAQLPTIKYPDIKFRNYSMEHGLSMSSVLQITQTKNGYLWVATPDKLNQFDGYEFKAIRHVFGNTNTPSDNYITALYPLPDGSLLIGTNSGYVDRYFNETKTFEHYKIWNTPEEGVEIRGFCRQDSQTVFAFTMGGGIISIHVLSGEISRINSDNSSLESDFVQAMCKVSDGVYAVGTDKGVFFLELSSNNFTKKVSLQGHSISSLAVYKGKLYAGTAGTGLFAIDLRSYHEQAVPLGNEVEDEFSNINVLLADSKGNLWIGTTFDGLVIINSDGSQYVIQRVFTDNFSLINNTIYGIYEDMGGNIWLGTISGISAYMPLNQQFKFYRPNPEKPGTLSKQIYPIYEDRQHQIWLGTLEGGVNRFDPQTEKFTVFNRSNTSGLTSNSIRAIFQDSRMRYWIGTGEKGLFEFFPQEKRFVPATDDKGGLLSHSPIRCIYEDKHGLLWIGTTEGLVGWNPLTKETYKDFESSTRDYPPQVVYDIKPGRATNLVWIASFGQGLFEFDIENKVFVSVYSTGKKGFSNMNNNVMSIKKMGADTLLLGTFGGGINIFDLKRNVVTSFSEVDGLPNDAVYGLLVDKNGNWWVSSNKGIAKINPVKRTVQSFNRPEQVQSLEFNEASFLASSQGLFLFGGIEGLNVFDPMQIKPNPLAPFISITQMKIFDKVLNTLGAEETQLAYNKNYVGFDYVGIELLDPDKVQYRYMLEGVDENWIDAGTRRFVQYSALRPGKYVFKVRAVSQDGIWSQQIASKSFEILPPFWLTWWFITLIAIVLILALYGSYVVRVNKLKSEFQTKVTEVELKALRSQMNPHFIFNSINSIQYYILNKNPKVAYSYLTKFSTLMRKILQNSRVNYISLEEELESLQLYIDLENIRIEGELLYKVEIDENVSPKTLLIPSMVLQPFVENSIVHGLLNKEGEKRITLRVRKEVSHIYCEIEDNGIGREKAKELNAGRTNKHESTAMKATIERLELLNMGTNKKLTINIIDLVDEKNDPKGVLVQVFIPFKKG
ncbi:MAG: histidine kinase [Bacteroidia bacterium]|nr:histidine kinase [Bacteroidia bacterium]